MVCFRTNLCKIHHKGHAIRHDKITDGAENLNTSKLRIDHRYRLLSTAYSRFEEQQHAFVWQWLHGNVFPQWVDGDCKFGLQ